MPRHFIARVLMLTVGCGATGAITWWLFGGNMMNWVLGDQVMLLALWLFQTRDKVEVLYDEVPEDGDGSDDPGTPKDDNATPGPSGTTVDQRPTQWNEDML